MPERERISLPPLGEGAPKGRMRENLKRSHNPILKRNSRQLRSEMTKEEKHLWYDFLKTLPFTVYRQRVIGKYIVDFYIASFKIVIEIDGSQHYEKEGRDKDIERVRPSSVRPLV
ncbi:MAG: endonuclease domain-containing protein [Lachnospiraceae bacterium]|nr:endonuclease domain-containing protein [Lachnospiraceae bacterium]